MTQETFVQATVHLHQYEGEEARAWIFKVARNAYIDEWRKQKRKQSLLKLSIFSKKEDILSPYGIPEDALLNQELSRELGDLLKFLPEQYRSILYLREVEQFSYKEIMEALQMSEEQVKVTLHRARKRLAALAQQERVGV